TPWSAPKRVVDILGEEGEQLTRDDFVIVNVWRPITTVHSSPVALCDARSVSGESLIPAERRGKGRVGEVYVVRYDEQQRWMYFPEIAPGEVLLIKTFDSREDGRARWCVHTAVEETGETAKPPRESVETRLFAFL
ncbi:MAG: methyltransferase, partial [Gammaproteobacteria bacterium]|nr:methyltransferase [Gammaproteobacteria bacterium]